MKIGVLIIGDEILSGRRADKHLARSIELLAERGLQLAWARYVGDEPARITRELREAFAGGDLVFSFGGIGATPDDHTRACAAEALGRPLVLHPEARELILERGRETAAEQGQPFDPDDPIQIHRLNMGCFPKGAEIIPNPYNRIPGFSVGDVHFVPGFPVMAWPMVAALLDTRYAHLHRSQVEVARAVIVFGGLEAALTPLMQELEARFAGVRIFSLPSVDHPQWGRHIELGVKGQPLAAEQAFIWLLEELRQKKVQTGPEVVQSSGGA